MKPEAIKIINQLKLTLDDALFLNGQTKEWSHQMNLLGNVPELDSMSIMTVIAAIKKDFGIFIDDEDINAEVFATLESLSSYIYSQLSSANQALEVI